MERTEVVGRVARGLDYLKTLVAIERPYFGLSARWLNELRPDSLTSSNPRREG